MMSNYKYYEHLASLQEQFISIKEHFRIHIFQFYEELRHLPVNKERLNSILKSNVQTNKELKNIITELEDLRTNVNERGFGIFKHGNVKKKFDLYLTKNQVQELKDEMKSYNQALIIALSSIPNTPVKEYIADYINKFFGSEINKSENPNI